MLIRDLWRRISRTRYTRSLEAEVARLRVENQALLNSILGIAGVPPILVSQEALKAEQAGEAVAPTRGNQLASGRVLRRRSWQQVNRMREIDSSRKGTPSA